MRLLLCRRKTATVLVAPSSKTERFGGRTRCLVLEPRGYPEEEKEKILRTYRKRDSERAISRIFGISRYRLEPMA